MYVFAWCASIFIRKKPSCFLQTIVYFLRRTEAVNDYGEFELNRTDMAYFSRAVNTLNRVFHFRTVATHVTGVFDLNRAHIV